MHDRMGQSSGLGDGDDVRGLQKPRGLLPAVRAEASQPRPQDPGPCRRVRVLGKIESEYDDWCSTQDLTCGHLSNVWYPSRGAK